MFICLLRIHHAGECKLYKRICIYSAILVILFALSVAPVFGLSKTITTGVGGKTTSATTKIDLDDSAVFTEETLGGSGALYQKTEVAGSGENSVEKTLSGDGYTVNSAFGASGTVDSQISAAASGDGAAMKSRTDISSADAGYVASSSSTAANDMIAVGWFSGDSGYMSSDLTAVASERAVVGGSTDILGVDCLDQEVSGNVAAGGDVLMSLDGLYQGSSGDLGGFGMLAANGEKSRAGRDNQLSASVNGLEGDPNSYKLAGWRWADNPNIQLYVKSDRYLSGERLTSSEAKNAISAAAETWDDATGQELFNDNVIVSSRLNTDRYDYKNVHAWKYIPSSALAYARTYYYPSRLVVGADGKSYYKAVESDVCYNTRYSWSTSGTDGTPYRGGAIDVQTVALHELGHTAGLGDIYGTELAADSSQIMNLYNDIQRTLGAGDTEGIQKLYGA
jgi:hypothetical protein